MAKVEAGKIEVEYEQINNLYEKLSSLLETFKYEMKVKNINFEIKIPKKLPKVYWDFDKLHYHAINNMISNAIKFTNDGGNITFKVESQDNKNIVITLADDGIGISKDKRKTIFKKYDTHNNTKVFKGTGLGLYNAYYFVKQHHGDIKVSKGISGKGTAFITTIPINPNLNVINNSKKALKLFNMSEKSKN